MSLTAADLQRRHELEGSPDPFPSLNDPAKTRAPAQQKPQELDTSSADSFPSLAPSAPATAPAKTGWGVGPRIKAPVKPTVASDSFTLPVIDLSTAGKDGKATSLGEIMRHIQSQYKVKLEASTNQKTRQTSFLIKADTHKELEKAKKSLLSALSPIVTLIVNAPASTIPSIIGPKGANLIAIRDKTNVKIDIPRRDTLAPPSNGPSSGKASPVNGNEEDEEEEPTIPITIVGPEPMALEAQASINATISAKTSRTTQRVRDIPSHVLPFVTARRANFIAVAEGADIILSLNRNEITVAGDRTAVVRVIELIKATVEGFSTELTSLKMSLPKRQHRLLVGHAVDAIMSKSKCAVVVSAPEEPSDEVTVWGQPADLPGGLGAVMERANSQYIHEFPLPGPITLSKQLLTYFTRIGYPNTLSKAHPGVIVHTPHPTIADKATSLNIDIVGEKSAVDAVVRQISEFIGKLIGATKEVPVEWLIHRIIIAKQAKKIKAFHEAHNVQVFFPAESAEQSAVLLVYDPLSPSASPSPVEKSKHLEEVAKELLKLEKEAGVVKSETVTVDQKWHEAVVGKNNTTLNAIIGEETTLSIKLGADAGDADAILIRGASTDVDRAVKEILAIVEAAKNDEIVSSFSLEFDVDKEFVGRIVGAQGAGVNKLRDQLGVKVDVSDDFDSEKDKDATKKKPKTLAHSKSKVKITGRKENVEEAKKRILTQIERLADETSEVLKIATQYHSGLIGSSGKYAIRLEEKYGVKITFPRHSGDGPEGKTREPLKADEVLIKGGKKGVAQAKAELLEAVEFEKESNNIIKFTVPTRSIARILGKGGASINEIKDSTDAQIDVDKNSEADGVNTTIQVRGTKKAIAAAKAAILEISNQVGEEVSVTVTVENKFHRTLIGAGGQGLKDLISRCGGPADSKQQAGLLRFPRQGESPADEVRLRGEPKLVAKLKAELEKLVTELRDRVVLGVEVPSGQHRALIGRGGQHLNELQDRTGAQVQFPGSRSYNQVGEPANLDELKAAEAADIVKVSGSRAACEAAIAELKAQVKAPEPKGISSKVTVPLKYHNVVSQQGSFFRTLRSYGVQVDHSVSPSKGSGPTRPAAGTNGAPARIDDAEEETSVEAEWQVTPFYQDAEEGDSVWTIKAKDQAGLDRAEKAIKDAIASAETQSHIGFLTLADRGMFPRIVGTKGANVARLRGETGADITVGRDNNTIVIAGTEAQINAAKDAILKMGSNAGRSQRHYED